MNVLAFLRASSSDIYVARKPLDAQRALVVEMLNADLDCVGYDLYVHEEIGCPSTTPQIEIMEQIRTMISDRFFHVLAVSNLAMLTQDAGQYDFIERMIARCGTELMIVEGDWTRTMPSYVTLEPCPHQLTAPDATFVTMSGIQTLPQETVACLDPEQRLFVFESGESAFGLGQIPTN